MNSRWQANRIGLINFWYYDEQEFYFSKGRMLLRGSNGSGKSVTMQSVIPLLLDGNLSPERLDPFGSRDRKMSSYLLEEDDGREERTGYLYLELKREENDTYLTLGMGIRARKGKPLDKWYFSVTDGRRIGTDLFLFKEAGEKVTLSKKELENRLMEGGVVFDRQADYMDYVNRQVFGFETVEEYKEMIDLLIQLRTPKLSKDFKPSVINEILSDSLQPMSDEDLRPMSEAIENMDTMAMNLKTRQEAKQAAERIGRIFDRYNQLFLYEKAKNYVDCQKALEQLNKESTEQAKRIHDCETTVKALDEEYNSLYAQKEAQEKERDSLSKSDAVALKQQEMEIQERLNQNQTAWQEKSSQLEAKQEKYIETRHRQESALQVQEQKQGELDELMEAMQDAAEDMSFQEHAFMCSDLKAGFAEPFSFQTHLEQLKQLQEGIGQGTELLKEESEKRRYLDEETRLMDQEKRKADSLERRVNECRSQFVQIQNELKEAFYQWSSGNDELPLNQELFGDISKFIESYHKNNDFTIIRSRIADLYFQKKGELQEAKQKAETTLEVKKEEIRQIREELSEWEADKQPEPIRSEAMLKNRQALMAKKIPFHEFYKVIEFGPDLSKEQCDRLEEALLHMGILDALVVDEQYREAVLNIDAGMCDRYLFIQNQRAKKSLLDILDLNDAANDIFFNQQVTSILNRIAYDSDDNVAINKDGSYQLGVLTGTITRTYEAGYIGVRARERNRQAQIARLKQTLAEADQEAQSILQAITEWGRRLSDLQAEYDRCPEDKDLREALRMLDEAEHELTYCREDIRKIEEKIRQIASVVQELRKQAAVIAEKLYLSCHYDVFKKAREAGESYRRMLQELESGHQIYLNLKSRANDLLEQMELLDDDMENIRYDEGNYKRACQKDEIRLQSVREQLGLTNYEEIQERLNACLQWLAGFSKRAEDCVKKKAEQESRREQLFEKKEQNQERIDQLQKKREYLLICFEKELALGYLSLPEDCQKAVSVVNYLAPTTDGVVKDDINRRLNQIYFENRGFLNDYQLTQTEVFQELDEELLPGYPSAKRLDIHARYRGVKINFRELLQYLDQEIEELRQLIQDGDRELFEDILANTISRKIRGKINGSNAWVEKMNALMGAMNTSSGLKLSLRWRSKTAENENQLDTKDLVDLLRKDYRMMREEEAQKLSLHFRSKVDEARRSAKDSGGMISFYQVMKETLDYRKWFEFQLFSQKSGEKQRELTNSVFGTFSGGEKAMAMYVPLFSAVVAKYKGGREDAPRLISLDEAFAGVDNRNIRDMFRLMTEFKFNFIINSQVLWGDCDTLDSLAIYQLIRPQNAKFVTVMPYLWNGTSRELLEHEQEVERVVPGIGGLDGV